MRQIGLIFLSPSVAKFGPVAQENARDRTAQSKKAPSLGGGFVEDFAFFGFHSVEPNQRAADALAVPSERSAQFLVGLAGEVRHSLLGITEIGGNDAVVFLFVVEELVVFLIHSVSPFLLVILV